ncbi:protein of unknown function DUF955 [Methylocella silvestris BL2]|uniref:IrrE N-terminal-like domain-containing protein n=1 Tax=Methylocella silvestris (strain DSM 15510 / CIP 108128 / LMG 27833 / NCIMB 13906 / BL2) TaxID=395965 RepID=B8EKY1_METSB|nr:ImmA/IrrE family metallo-endopeptidase [Methylocella silvestris]ACK52009.1 protein of unknown function DUF955 [Methylocella silvestris BL2]
MVLDGKIAVTVFKKVRQARHEIKAYCIAPDQPVIPLGELKRIVGQMYHLAINVHELPYKSDRVKGLMERYIDRVTIYVKEDLDEYWKRFTVVKELCHVMNDEPDDWSYEGVNTLKNLLTEYTLHQDSAASRASQSEIFAEIAAVELLYPFEQRAIDINGGSGKPIAEIARWYHLPELIVSRSLLEGYHGTVAEIWGLVGSE